MGIDIFACWNGQSESEDRAQAAAWLTTTAGGKGYLREAYHGAPYATKYLCAEAFKYGDACIPAVLLRDRLPHTLTLVEERARTLYDASDKEVEEEKQSFRDFVGLCERKEKETGEPVLIVASF
jgi:hypothetical protein